ncbi:MAG: L,D-transpeptidase family protein [Acidimicrobiales bacterium]
MIDWMRYRRSGSLSAPVGLLLIALLASACSQGATAEMTFRPAGTEAYLEEMATTTTAAATTSTSVAEEEPLPGLGVGSESPAVLTLEQKLTSLRYFAGQVDEAFDGDTRDAVMAFQKVTGMDRTGRATDDVLAAVSTTNDPPAPLVAAGGYKRVEIDLDRQTLFLYEMNKLDLILNVSTGSNERFCSEGWCRRAVTPTGSFVIYDKRSGWERSPLGQLYNSQYFNGGIAIHGSSSVPGYPASHGCVRISMNAAEWFPDRISVGTPVYVFAADEPVPTPIGANAPPVSTPTTIVADTTPTPVGPATTTTTPNLLSNLLTPPTTTP